MTGSVVLPLLFLDVDGPLIPFGTHDFGTHDFGTHDGQYPTYSTASDADSGSGAVAANPLLSRIDPAHGPRLSALPCELVWATTWMADANECIAPRLGLPRLDVVIWPEPCAVEEEQDVRSGLHWKTRPLVERAAGRAFVWVDDEITDRDRAWVAAHHPGRALLHRIDPRRGVTGADYAVLDSWLRQPSGT